MTTSATRGAARGTSRVSGPGQSARPGPARGSGTSTAQSSSAGRRRAGGRSADGRRAPLHGEDPATAAAVGGVGAEPVDRLGREGHEPAGPQRPLDGRVDRPAAGSHRRAVTTGGAQELERGVDERERLRRGEVVRLAG